MENIIVIGLMLLILVAIALRDYFSNNHREMMGESVAIINQFMIKTENNIKGYFDGDEIWHQYARVELMFLAIVVYVDVVMNNNKSHKYDDLVKQVVDEWITVILSVMTMENNTSNREAIRANINKRGKLYQPILNKAVGVSEMESLYRRVQLEASMQMSNNYQPYYGETVIEGRQLSSAGLYEKFLTILYDVLEDMALDFSVDSVEDAILQRFQKPKINNFLPKLRHEIFLCKNPELTEDEERTTNDVAETFVSRQLSFSFSVAMLIGNTANFCKKYQTRH